MHHGVAANDQYNDASFNIFSLVIEMMFDCAFIVALSLGAKITLVIYPHNGEV